jgi:DNA-binding protein H-NS
MTANAEAKAKVPFNLEEMKVEDLNALKSAVDAEIRTKMEAARKALLAEINEKAAAIGLPYRAIFQAFNRRPATATVTETKYRGPQGQTWNGRGRPPTWLLAEEGKGRKKEEFQV